MTLRQRQPRVKSPKHLEYIRSLCCCICGDNTSTEAAHIRTASLEHGKEHTGMAEKASDKWAVPLCGKHHREQHAFEHGELAWWRCYGKDPFLIAMTLRRT
jgi:hypothetical protein